MQARRKAIVFAVKKHRLMTRMLYFVSMRTRNSSEGLSYKSADSTFPLITVLVMWYVVHYAIIENKEPLSAFRWMMNEKHDKTFQELIPGIFKGLAVNAVGLTAWKSLQRHESSSFEGRRKTMIIYRLVLPCKVGFLKEIFKVFISAIVAGGLEPSVIKGQGQVS